MNEEKLKEAEIKRLETELDMVQTAWQELKDENMQLRELVCEYGLSISDQDYLLRPDTISRTISIMAEEKGKDGWYESNIRRMRRYWKN